MSDPRLASLAPVLLYRTMDLPEELREGAVLFGLSMQSPASLARAGYGGTPLEMADALFSAILAGSSGTVFAVDEWSDVVQRIATPDRKIHLDLPDLLGELARLGDAPAEVRDERLGSLRGQPPIKMSQVSGAMLVPR